MGCPVESSWQVVQSVRPLIDLWARESGPGEIWAAAGLEVHKIVNNIHPRSPGIGREQIASTMRMFETVVFASVRRQIADFRNRSALLFDQVSENQALRKRCRCLSAHASPPLLCGLNPLLRR